MASSSSTLSSSLSWSPRVVAFVLLLSTLAVVPTSGVEIFRMLTFSVPGQTTTCFEEYLEHGATADLTLDVLDGGLNDIGLEVTSPSGERIAKGLFLFNGKPMPAEGIERIRDSFSNVRKHLDTQRAVDTTRYSDEDRAAHARVVEKLAARAADSEKFLQQKVYDESTEHVEEWTVRESGWHKVCFNNEFSRWTAKKVQFQLSVEHTHETLSGLAEEPAVGDDVHSLIQGARVVMTGLDNIDKQQKYAHGRTSRHWQTILSNAARLSWWSIGECAWLLSISLLQVLYLRRIFENKARSSRLGV